MRFMALLAVGWALMIAAWVGGNPPFAGADEEWHYVRALGVGEGQFVGPPAKDPSLGANPLQVAWTNQATRAVDVPGGLAPASVGCYIFDPRTPATCIDALRPPSGPTRLVTPVGTYELLPYLLPAVAMKAAGTPTAALTLGRIASALLGMALLAVALALLWDGTAISVLGLVIAVTPMVVFSLSLLNGSGLEIASAIAFSAALIRLPRPGAWAALAVSGAVLALSRSAGPLWVGLIGALFLSLNGWRASWTLVRAGGWGPRLALGTVVLAVVVNRVWEAIYGPHLTLGLANARHAIGLALHEWWHASLDVIGRFGYLEVHVPLVTAILWVGLAAAVAVLAVWLGTRRERLVVAAGVALAVGFPPLFWLVQYRHTGFDLQGRHMLPLLVALPLLCGEVLRRHRSPRRLVPAALVLSAAVQFVGWWVYARRSAVGTDGPLFFLGKADWSPAGGWLPWALLAGLGSLALIAAAARLLSSSHAGGVITEGR